jgi:hypothetical protein
MLVERKRTGSRAIVTLDAKLFGEEELSYEEFQSMVESYIVFIYGHDWVLDPHSIIFHESDVANNLANDLYIRFEY